MTPGPQTSSDSKSSSPLESSRPASGPGSPVCSVLVLTVGTGSRDDPEGTLFAPLRKSIRESGCRRAVLLPSSVTAELADRFTRRPETPTDVDLEVRPLPEQAEFDADRAYAHFDSVLNEILREEDPQAVRVDFTRGTKAMSAAAVLAAVRWSIPHLVYVDGERERDVRGMVRPGSEVVRRLPTTTVDRHRRLDLAHGLMSRGNFSAVVELLPGGSAPFPEIRCAAGFYAAWDRLDYRQAADSAVPGAPRSQGSRDWTPLWPTREMEGWVQDLAREVDRSQHKAMAHRLRLLIVDLLASGERRVRHGQHEDAFVRAYRVLELIGQARLFDHGLDSANLDPGHEAVQRLQRKLQKKKSRPLGRTAGNLTAARFQVSRLLNELGDPLAERLLRYDKGREAARNDRRAGTSDLVPGNRNNSLLIHGFSAKAPTEPGSLEAVLKELVTLARKDAENPSTPGGAGNDRSGNDRAVRGNLLDRHAGDLFDRRLRIARSMPPGDALSAVDPADRDPARSMPPGDA